MRIRSTEHAVLVRDVEAPEAGDGASDVVLAPDDGRLSPYLVAAFDPEDPVARLARSLRLSISALPLPDEPPIRSVAVLGVDAVFEASVVAANLAIAYAQGGTPTILVDANLEEPSQHLLFGRGEGKGLAAALSGEVDVRALVEPSPVRNLATVTAGHSAVEAPVLLDGERFHRRAMPLLESFGMMIVDAGAPFSEPPALCEALDGALLVVRRNATAVGDVRHLTQRLAEMDIRVVGTVMVH